MSSAEALNSIETTASAIKSAQRAPIICSKNLICFASIILTKPSKSPLALARPALKGNFQPYNPLQKPLIALQFVLLQPLLAKYKQQLDYN
jgi:hypothetical protein